jgi:hypothetical protein
MLQRGAAGVEHVRPGVTVGYGIDVQRIDLVDRALKTLRCGFEDAQEGGTVALRRDARDCTIDVQFP